MVVFPLSHHQPINPLFPSLGSGGALAGVASAAPSPGGAGPDGTVPSYGRQSATKKRVTIFAPGDDVKERGTRRKGPAQPFEFKD